MQKYSDYNIPKIFYIFNKTHLFWVDEFPISLLFYFENHHSKQYLL